MNFGPKKPKRVSIPDEFEPILNNAKEEFKFLTGKKKCSNQQALRFIGSSHKLWSGSSKYDLFGNKKGFVADTLLATAALIVIVLVVAIVTLILFNFNSAIQEHDSMTPEAKEASEFAELRFSTILGYSFLFGFIGFFIYTIITAILINNIHPIFWILGLVFLFVSTLIVSGMKLLYGSVESQSILGPFIMAIPGATWYFSNIEIINILWMITQFTIIYLVRE